MVDTDFCSAAASAFAGRLSPAPPARALTGGPVSTASAMAESLALSPAMSERTASAVGLLPLATMRSLRPK